MEVSVPSGHGGAGPVVDRAGAETSEPGDARPAPGAGGRRARRRSRRRAIGVLAVALALVTGSVAVALVDALGARGNDPGGVKIIEWLRGHGAGGLVNDVERWWYTGHPPRVGGRPRHGIPRARPPIVTAHAASRAAPPTVPADAPADLAPIASPPLPREGVWQPTGKLVDGRAAVYETYLRPDPIHTSLVTGVVWMDRRLLRGALYNGLQVPGGGPWVHGARLAAADDASVVAAFNSGFRLDASRGGYFTEGRTVRPLVDGRASLVITRDGTLSIGQWGRDATLTPDVVSVRQNLDLIVDGGRPAPGLVANDHARWGATLGGKVYVWRSAAGVDRAGNLIYVGGPGLNITTLAQVLARAGCVRAMELDINSEWVSFYTYTGTTPADIRGVKLLGSLQRPPDRYLHDGTRDFVALFAR